MSTLLGLIIAWPLAVLATWQTVETWHHGSLFDSWRAYYEARSGFLSDLLLCPFCFSHWAALVHTFILFPALDVANDPHLLVLLPIYWLSVTRGSNLCNDICHSFTRTPRLDQAAIENLEELAHGNYVHEPSFEREI